jgi:glucose-6-phosphate 1-epimerase
MSRKLLRCQQAKLYYNTETNCIIIDTLFNRRIRVAKSGSKITTVWNPGEETCLKIDDIPDDGFHNFVCIEAVNAFNDLIYLAPGEMHETSAIIGIGRINRIGVYHSNRDN